MSQRPSTARLPSGGRMLPRPGRLASLNQAVDNSPNPNKIPASAAAASPKRRRASVPGAQKAQRTSKTSQKLVVLPSAPQTRAFGEEDLTLGYETDAGVKVRDQKSAAERMSKEQRQRAGYKRLTAYCIAESFKMKLLAPFLKREHNAGPRVYDEALYALYHLPLLPGYGPGSNIRSSQPHKASDVNRILSTLSEAEENGYQGTYFPTEREHHHDDGYITSSPVENRKFVSTMTVSQSVDSTTSMLLLTSEAEETERETEQEGDSMMSPGRPTIPQDVNSRPSRIVEEREEEQEFAEVIFFEYGVVVFFGLNEGQEKGILEDIQNAGILYRRLPEDDWEVEECHFEHDLNITYPRIYNDFFTLKSRSHLLKLSIAHALAQSTLLARYESNAQRVVSSPMAVSIPRQLAEKGALKMKRHDALKLTGRLFKLRQDVNLVSNVLDVPELFWSEASLKELYDAVREYMEISGRVQVLNEKLSVASDFLDAIHDHLNNHAMERITWIVIWLIVAAILVERGEVVARLIYHATVGPDAVPQVLSHEEALRILDGMSG